MKSHCQPYRELLALRLYDEASEEEGRRLIEHLAGCEGCEAFAAELDAGLGEQLRVVADDLPEGWNTALRRSVEAGTARVVPLPSKRRSAVTRSALTFATGLAAGLLLTLTWRTTSIPTASVGSPAEAVAGTAEAFCRSSPPPHATSRGQFAQLGALLRR